MDFLLDKGSEIIIYGAGSMGISWVEKAVSIGFKVKLFIDRRAVELKKINKIPVVTLEAYNDIADKNDIVIIMLQNVMWHRAIVEQLQRMGIRKVIFFPMHALGMSKEGVFCLRRKYNECIRFDFDDSLKIPILYNDIMHDKDGGVIWENKKEIIAWTPVELCYSNQGNEEGNIWRNDFGKETIELWMKYVYGRSLLALRPYWELFSFLDGKTADCSMYLKLYRKEGYINDQTFYNELLKDRNRLVDIFKEEICRGNEFFEQSPANSGVGNRGKIIIYDGIHRSVFLANRGYWWIPVRFSNSNYHFLFNVEAVQRLKDFITVNNITELEYPLETFGFYSYPIKHQYTRVIWQVLIREIADRGWNINIALDLSLTDAYFARMFYREGVQEIYCLLDNKSEFPLLVNDIFRINDINFIYDIDYLYQIMNKSEIIIIRIEQLANLFLNNDFEWKECLKCIIVYDILVEEAELLFERFFENNRRCNLLKKYVADGMMKGMYIVE